MVYDSNEIQKILPHRYPFLLVDQILSIEGNKIIGKKCVSVNEMQFLGHYPDYHLFPGVLVFEAMAQTGSVLILVNEQNKGKLPIFAGLNKARLRKEVRPGDVMMIESELTNMRRGIGFASCVAKVDGVVVADAELMFTLK